jgi:hypothetical protein
MAVELIAQPAVILSDDADQVIDIEYDGSLSGVPLLLTVRTDPSYADRHKTLITSDRRGELSEDLADWEIVVATTVTTTPATGYAAAIVVTRAEAAVLEPGVYRYVGEIARTDTGNVSPIVAPFWISVRSAVSRPFSPPPPPPQ